MELDGIGSDVRVVLQAVLYFMTISLGFLVSVPIGLTSSKFEGGCIMYAKSYRDHSIVHVTFGPKRNCNFVIGTHVVLSIVYSTGMVVLLAYALVAKCRQKTMECVNNFVFFMITLGINAFTTFLCFVAACIITVGLSSYCSEMKEQYPGSDHCSEFQKIQWLKGDGSSFYKNYSLALVVSWIATGIWLLQSIISAVALWRDMKSGQSLGRSRSRATTLENEVSVNVSSSAGELNSRSGTF